MLDPVSCVIEVRTTDGSVLDAVERALDVPGAVLLRRDDGVVPGVSLYTLAGPGVAVRRAAVAAVRSAPDRVREVSLVPAGRTSLDACTSLAERLEREIVDRLGRRGAVAIRATTAALTVRVRLEPAPGARDPADVAVVASSLGGRGGVRRTRSFPRPDGGLDVLVDVEPSSGSVSDIGAAVSGATGGLSLQGCEVVGLGPRDSSLPGERVLEDTLERRGVLSFSSRLESAFPVPGGGAVAARTARLAAGLVLKVVRISIRSRAAAEIRAELEGAAGLLEPIARRFQELEDADQRAFMALLEAMRRPRSTPDETRSREDAIAAAAREAIRTPLETMEGVLRLIAVVEPLSRHARAGRLRAESDLAAAAELARAAVRSSRWNVEVNLPSLGESGNGFRDRAREIEGEFEREYDAVLTGLGFA